nr:retrovirus-related Pol polyprotein from transposon TNT 1-94 [Tanacetum cinerariifolium]
MQANGSGNRGRHGKKLVKRGFIAVLDVKGIIAVLGSKGDNISCMKNRGVASHAVEGSPLIVTLVEGSAPCDGIDARLISKRVANQEETPSLDNILSLTNRFEDIFGVTSNSDESNGEEADISNIEVAIIASPAPTLKIHKDHPKSQIIGPMDTPIQTRNKSKEEEWIDYDEVFAHLTRIEAIRLFLAYASFMGFTEYQMDMKSAFLYGTIDEEVYVMQPPGFQDPKFPAKVYKVEKSMYGLHQALRAWSSNTPMDKENPWGNNETRKDVDLHLYRSMIGSLMYLTASRLDIKRIFRYLKGHPKLGLWYPKESPFDLVAFSYSNYGGATQDHKSTTGGYQFLGRSGVVPTASTTISTATPIFATATTITPYTRRKGKEKMVETHTPKKKKRLQEQIDIEFARELEEELEREAQRMNAQIARDEEIANIHAEEELQQMIEDHHSKILQYQAQQRKTRTKKQKRDLYMAVIRNNLGWKVKDFKGMSFEEVEAKFKTVWEQIEEEVPEEVKSSDEFPGEKIKELIRLVPIEEVYIEALQVKHPIIDWKVHIEGQKSYWKITRLGGSSASYQFFVDMLKQIDREDLNQLWALVKETLSVRPATDEKEMELWVELKRLY